MQPPGALYLAIFGWAAGAVLAYGAKLARVVPELALDTVERLEEVVAEALFAIVLWLPIAWAFARNQVRMLATTGALPATVRPERYATLFALVALALFRLMMHIRPSPFAL